MNVHVADQCSFNYVQKATCNIAFDQEYDRKKFKICFRGALRSGNIPRNYR